MIIIKYKSVDGWDALNNILGWFGCPDHPVQTDEISRIIDRTECTKLNRGDLLELPSYVRLRFKSDDVVPYSQCTCFHYGRSDRNLE